MEDGNVILSEEALDKKWYEEKCGAVSLVLDTRTRAFEMAQRR